MALVVMVSGNALDPVLVRGISKFPGKGVAFRNADNKMLCYEAEPDPFYQDVIVNAIVRLEKEGRSAAQPDWEALFAQADMKREAAKAAANKGGSNATPGSASNTRAA